MYLPVILFFFLRDKSVIYLIYLFMNYNCAFSVNFKLSVVYLQVVNVSVSNGYHRNYVNYKHNWV